MTHTISFQPLGDSALFIRFGDEISPSIHENIQQFIQKFQVTQPEWLVEIVPAYTSICVHFDLLKVASCTYYGQSITEFLEQYIQEIHQNIGKSNSTDGRLIEVPVVYGGAFGPDLSYVAQYNGMTEEEVIRLHTSSECLVHMLGFSPGFAFMGGMNPTIGTPRKEIPRLAIPAGSVGIAGEQTGVYPVETPGGWQIIGRTPQPFFMPNQLPPTYLQAGDRIRFVAISEEEFSTWGAKS
ncbi:5-oxoprolinase subunit PxpB [Solibacillus sp. FSL H8-0538]|uniref:5-oxoprolinase subunit PxpB n=1 Tax=Solibacillus sp. FSL H8-0538 TaxID=2921400 RepID=UPI0030F7B8CD